MDPPERAYRLYVTTIDASGRERSEGPRTFTTAGEALDWIKAQTTVTIIEATIFLGDELLVREDVRGG